MPPALILGPRLPEGGAAEIVQLGDGFRAYTAEPGRLAQEIAMHAAARGIGIVSLNTMAPSLEDVFLHITGGTPRGAEPPHAA